MGRIIQVEGLSKAYRIGQFSSGTLYQDFNRFLARMQGKEDPLLKIGEINDRGRKGDSSLVWSLRDVSFSVEQGTTLGIIGKNGAGKSTLLKLLSRVTAPTEGLIRSRGRVASLLEVGTGFHPELTGRENVFLNGSILGMRKKEIRNKLDEIIEFSGVERYIDTPVKRYSSGMFVRLAFSVAAHLESEILILDEVLAVGDAEFQKKCYEKMTDISTSKERTILFVSHNLTSVRRLCNRGIVLENGELNYMGDVAGAIDHYMRPTGASDETSPGDYGLTNRENAYGQDLLIRRATLLNKAGFPTSTFSSGDFFQLKLRLSRLDSYETVLIGIIIKTVEGINLASLNTGMRHPSNQELMGRNETLVLEIDKLPLMRGKYLVDVSISDGRRRFDFIENVIELNVDSGDYYENGYPLEKGNWYFCLDGRWKYIAD